MKTSFYFLFWIIIYPLMDLLGIDAGQYSMLIALAAIIGIGYLVNRLLGSINVYSHVLALGRELEFVYTGNVKGYTKKVKQELFGEVFCSIYLLVALLFTLAVTLMEGINGWIEVAIFGVITYGAIARSLLLQKAYRRLRENPTAEECMNVAVDVFHLPYAEYFEYRQGRSFAEMLPSRPRFFTLYEWVAIIISAITCILGTLVLIMAISLITKHSWAVGAGVMYLAYAMLAIYFGVKDLIGSIRDMRKIIPAPANYASNSELSNN